jgi:hypothetical protein
MRAVFRYPIPSPFVQAYSLKPLDTGYLLIDFVEKGELLSDTFSALKNDQRRRQNLFRDLSRILLSLGKMAHPRIGSFIIDHQGYISLSNRPLTLRLQWLENEGIPTNTGRQTTYSTLDSYVLDLLSYHDNRLIHQPNSISSVTDGRKQMAAIALMRSVLPQFLVSRQGPFIFTLTDLHQSNIFVDQDWHITSLIDLEWACSLPVEMQQPPHWMTGRDVDDLTEDALEEFDRARNEFMTIYQQEEEHSAAQGLGRSQIMQRSWQLGGFWYFHALATTKGFYNLYLQHIQPRFSQDLPFEEVSSFWRQDAEQILQSKLDDRQEYLRRLDEAAISQRKSTEAESEQSEM